MIEPSSEFQGYGNRPLSFSDPTLKWLCGKKLEQVGHLFVLQGFGHHSQAVL